VRYRKYNYTAKLIIKTDKAAISIMLYGVLQLNKPYLCQIEPILISFQKLKITNRENVGGLWFEGFNPKNLTPYPYRLLSFAILL